MKKEEENHIPSEEVEATMSEVVIPLSMYAYEVIERDYDVHSRFFISLDRIKAHTFYVKMRQAYICDAWPSSCTYTKSGIYSSPYDIQQVRLDSPWNDECSYYHEYEEELVEDYEALPEEAKMFAFPAPTSSGKRIIEEGDESK
jgi:hypothetical protein